MIAQYPISVPILLHLLFLVWPPPPLETLHLHLVLSRVNGGTRMTRTSPPCRAQAAVSRERSWQASAAGYGGTVAAEEKDRELERGPTIAKQARAADAEPRHCHRGELKNVAPKGCTITTVGLWGGVEES